MAMAGTLGDGRVVSQAEERKVIFASSLGTVFEWYDFYLYATLAPFFAALFFPPGNETAALLSAFATYAAGLPGAAVRRAGVRPHRRPGRAQIHLPRHHHGHGRLDLRGRPAADLRDGRLAGAAAAGRPAPAAGPGARRRIWRGRHLRRRACATRSTRLRHELDPDHGDARLLPVAAGHRRCAARTWTRRSSPIWGWRMPFLVSLVLLVFSVYIRLRLNESPIFRQMKAEGKGSKQPLTESFLRYPEQQATCCWRCSAPPPGQGVVWYTGQFYALFFLHHHAQARLSDRPTR